MNEFLKIVWLPALVLGLWGLGYLFSPLVPVIIVVALWLAIIGYQVADGG